MKKVNKHIYIIFSSILLLLSSCDKQKDFELKDNPPGQNFNVLTDTLELDLETQLQDPIKTNNLSNDLIGEFKDPEFGISKAILHTELRLEKFDVKFPSAPKIDSTVLYLRYSNISDITGKLNSVQTWKVYELEDKFENKDYFSDSKIRIKSTAPIGTYTGTFDTTRRVLKISIENAFASKILALDAAAYSDNNSFLEQIKGIAIVPENSSLANGEGAIVYFNLRDNRSMLSIYYNDSLRFNLVINPQAIRVNTFTHDYTGTPVKTQLDDTAASFDKVYLQAPGGLKVHVKIPGLAGLVKTNENISLHQARFIFPEYANSALVAPSLALLYPRNNEGKNVFFNEEFRQNFTDNILSGYDGKWNNTEKKYSFIVTGHIQNVLSRYKTDPGYINRDFGMNLFVPADNPLSSQRVILSNKTAVGAEKPKLIITYTKLNER